MADNVFASWLRTNFGLTPRPRQRRRRNPLTTSQALEIRLLMSANPVAVATDAVAATAPTVDLVANAVDAPTSAARGSTITVYTEIDNMGSSPSGDFVVHYYLSTDSTITTSDTLLESFNHWSIGGMSFQRWREAVVLPSSLAAGNYYVGIIVDPSNVVAETNESNNTLVDATPITIAATAPVQADLDPYMVYGATTTQAGSQIAIYTDIDNKGTTASGAYTVNYYLSTDKTFTTSDILVKSLNRPGIAGLGKDVFTEAVLMPSSLTAGNYYIGVVVDPSNAIAEASESNNAQGDDGPVTITTPVVIDLDPYEVRGPASADRGTTISVFTDIDNRGTSPSGTFTINYYLSTDATVTTSDILLKTVTRSSIAGATYTQWTESVALPLSLAGGNYYIGVIVDPANAIAETNESNNAQAAAALITINAPIRIDLDPYSVDAPATGIRGSNISVFTDIENKGPTPSGTYTVSYYLSTNSTISTSDTLLKTVTRSSVAGLSRQQWTETVALPASLATGNYYIGVLVDRANAIAETNESNNAQADATVIAITAPVVIDLDPYSVDAPATGVRGSTVAVATNIENKGTSPSGTYTVSYYLSTNSTISTSDTLLKTVTRSSIAGKTKQSWNESVALPASLATGNYYIGVLVDPANAIAETVETNNAQADATVIAITAPIQIDLDPSVVNGPTAAVRGTTVSVSTVIENKGTSPSGSYTLRYYLSTDGTITTSDRLLKTVTRSSIAGGGAQIGTESVVLPSSLAAGKYFLGVIADPLNAIAETNETNNAQADSLPILIAATATPPFDIELNLTGDWTASQKVIFQEAALHWEQIITADLPNMVFEGRTIDDLLINAEAAPIDGLGGTLAQAGNDWVRSNTKLPFLGHMNFDTADLARMEADGTLLGVIMHEMGHVLGIGTLWEMKGLLQGKGTTSPTFTGTKATAEYNALFGTTASGVPVEGNYSDEGSRDGHWRESTFRTELMTPYVEASGVPMPISRITIASLADLGYTVNLSLADPYTKPANSSLTPSLQAGMSAGTGGASISSKSVQEGSGGMSELWQSGNDETNYQTWRQQAEKQSPASDSPPPLAIAKRVFDAHEWLPADSDRDDSALPEAAPLAGFWRKAGSSLLAAVFG